MSDELATVNDLDAVNRRIDELERQFKEAFPHGDYAGHCRYHEIQIEILLARRRLLAAVTEKSVGGIVFSFIVAFLYAAWQWLRDEIKK